jgi:acyl-CoA reductase-like NAD-dependent aldehyde dehydrogenase
MTEAMIIDGRRTGSDEVVTIRNPGTGEELGGMPVASPEQIQQAIVAAGRGSREMAALAAHERADLLFKIAARIAARGDELSRLLAAENGKPIRQTREEVNAAIRIFRGFGEEAKRLFGRQIPLDAVPGLEAHFAVTVREPLGVVAAIVPFNYPVELYAHKAAAALAAGNAVIVKPPDKCPLTLFEVAALIEEAGAPRAAHQVVAGGADAAQQLARAEGVDLISLTGGAGAGRELARLAAETLKLVDLELGANDVMIVCDDADPELAAEAVVLGRLARGNGQICCATKRIFVVDALYDDLAHALERRAGALVVGDQLQEDTDVGPLINEDAAQRVETAIADIARSGARISVGGVRRGAFIEPTVLTDVEAGAESVEQEVFGPVAPLMRIGDPHEAAVVANRSRQGLQAAVFTNDITRAFALARELQVGAVVINGSNALRAENMPFGGVRETGGAREGLHDTLLTMTSEKSIIVMNARS